MKGHQLKRPNNLTNIGVNNGKITNAYKANPTITVVAICRSESTPEGSMAANVPPKISVADIITVPIFRIDFIMPSYSNESRYSLKRLIKNIL